MRACVCCMPSVEKVPSSWGLAWPYALPTGPRPVEFLRDVGRVDNGWVGGAVKKQTRFLGSVSQGAIPIPFQAVSFSHSPQPMTAALGPPAPPALGLRYTARQGTGRRSGSPAFRAQGRNAVGNDTLAV